MDLSTIIANTRESLPLILVADAQNQITSKGSGFVYQQSNLVVTCAHVVAELNGGTVNLQFPDSPGKFIPAKIVITDHEHDIALLKFEPDKERRPLSIAADESKEGMQVVFSGYPFDLMSLATHQGIISSIAVDPTGMKSYLIDGTVNPGNSGGPLMNIDGEVLGVINATRRNRANVLGGIKSMPLGALSLHGIDLVELYGALIENLQLGVGYAVPSSYIPTYADNPQATGAAKRKKG